MAIGIIWILFSDTLKISLFMGWKELQSHNQCTICRSCYPLKEYFKPPSVYKPHSLVEYQKNIAFTEVSDHYRVILTLLSVGRATSEKEYFNNLLHTIRLHLLMYILFTRSNVRQILDHRIFSSK